MRILFCQIVEFLVRQRLDRRRIEDSFLEFEHSVDQILGRQGFTRPCFGGDQAIMPLEHGGNGVFLEGIKREGERNGGRKGARFCRQIWLNEIGGHS